jgi:hypothetical protein
MKSVGLLQHPLDICIWFTVDEAGKLDGILGVRMDDLIGAMAPVGKMAAACEGGSLPD